MLVFVTGYRKPYVNGTTPLSIKKALISEIQINRLMELNIHGSTHYSVSVVTQHRNSSRKINRKDFDIQIDEVQNQCRFSSNLKHSRNNLVVTNNMSTYENYYNRDRQVIGN